MTPNCRQPAYIYIGCFSIDVIFHLVEYALFEKYLEDLFSSAIKLKVIYGADLDYIPATEHELYRRFTAYIENEFPEWKLDKFIKTDILQKIMKTGTAVYLISFYVRK